MNEIDKRIKALWEKAASKNMSGMEAALMTHSFCIISKEVWANPKREGGTTPFVMR
jgi:hypothetical protein